MVRQPSGIRAGPAVRPQPTCAACGAGLFKGGHLTHIGNARKGASAGTGLVPAQHAYA